MPHVSSLERALSEEFKKLGLAPIPQHIVGQYIVDFGFPDEMIAVEADGTYWHGRPAQQARDRQKDGYLKSKGWIVVRLSEEDIKTSALNCALRVKAMLHRVDSQLVLAHP